MNKKAHYLSLLFQAEDSPIAHKLPKKRVASAPSAEEKTTGVGYNVNVFVNAVVFCEIIPHKKRLIECNSDVSVSITVNRLWSDAAKSSQCWRDLEVSSSLY